MALSASLHLRQSQSLVMTPQLLQSIRLLQLTHLELFRFVEQEIERNPLLEQVPDDDTAGFDGGERERDRQAGPRDDDGDGEGDKGIRGGGDDESLRETDRAIGSAAGETLGQSLDASYENVFPDDMGPQPVEAPSLLGQWKSMPGAGSSAGGDGFDLDDFTAGPETLHRHVEAQIALMALAPAERLIAAELCDHLDEAGYLAGDPAEIAARLGADRAVVLHVLERLQGLEPAGIFARSLSECLAIQLHQRDRYDPAMAALLDHLDLLARRDFQALKRICGVGEDDLLDMLAEIRALDPRPGTRFETGTAEAIVPDIAVTPASDGGWQIELNPETLPRVLVNQTYYAEVSRAAARRPEDQDFLNECLQSANWLTRSLDQRARTIMKVASEIVRQQDAFLAHGVDHLRPLNLKTVADAIGMHESTVSRVTSNKYMLTPRGVFELKYFFSVSIASAEGGDAHSAEAVRHRIRAMIAAEAPAAVLSDDDIVTALRDSGVEIARRTVAKYREAMGIPSSVKRRREKQALARSMERG